MRQRDIIVQLTALSCWNLVAHWCSVSNSSNPCQQHVAHPAAVGSRMGNLIAMVEFLELFESFSPGVAGTGVRHLPGHNAAHFPTGT